MMKRSSFAAVCSFHEFLEKKEDFLRFYRYVSQSVFLSCKTWAEIELARISVALLRLQIQFKIEATIPDTNAQPSHLSGFQQLYSRFS